MVFSFFFLAAGLAHAAPQAFTVDAAHSSVGFSIKHLTSKVRGEFTQFDSTFTFDEAHPEEGKVNVTIKAASVNTRNEKRDEHLKGPDFFNAEKFPELKFVSKKVSKGKSKTLFKVDGELTLLGVTKPLSLDVEYHGAAKDPWGNEKAGFTATGKVNRKDFGMVWNKSLDKGGILLGEEVALQIEVEAQVAAKK
jgi:polyisoprenoid-binding protein YceI